MPERFVVSDYVLATYQEGGDRHLKLRFDAQNPWWPENRNCAEELSILATSIIDRLGELLPDPDASVQLDLESSTRYGWLKCSFTRFGIIESIRCKELLRIFKEMVWGALDRVPPRRRTERQSTMSCEAGTAYTLGRKENGTEVDYHLDLPGWVTRNEFNGLIGNAQWWGGRLEADVSSPKGQMLLRGSTNNVAKEGTVAAESYQNFLQRVIQAHYPKDARQ